MTNMPCGACSFLQVRCPDNCFWALFIKPGEEEKFSVLTANTPVDSLKKRVIRCKKNSRQKFIDNLYEKEKKKCEPDALLLLAGRAEILYQESLRNENTGRPPSSHHASGSSSSFTETYPHFPAWKYNMMNPDGTFSSKPLTRPEHVPNVPWPDPVNVDLVEESMQMIEGLQSLVFTLSSQYVILNWGKEMEVANATRRNLEETIRSLESKNRQYEETIRSLESKNRQHEETIRSLESENRQYDPHFFASHEGNIEGGSSRKRIRSPNDA